MDRLGFGGPTCEIFQSLYTGDFIKFKVNGQLTDRMFLREGLKQGCSTSPMAYNIFKRRIAHMINTGNREFKIDGLSITAVFYADDVFIFGRSHTKLSAFLESFK